MMDNKVKQRLLQLIKEKTLFYQPVVLSSGKRSNYYIDAKQVTLLPEGAYLVAKLILDLIKDEDVEAIGGPTIGADPLLGAINCLSYLNQRPLQGFIVRKEQKKHGMQRFIEGPFLKKGTKVAIIDDVVTTGESIIRAVKAVKELGCEVVKVIALVDRCEGGREALKKYGLTLTSIFTIRELGIGETS